MSLRIVGELTLITGLPIDILDIIFTYTTKLISRFLILKFIKSIKFNPNISSGGNVRWKKILRIVSLRLGQSDNPELRKFGFNYKFTSVCSYYHLCKECIEEKDNNNLHYCCENCHGNENAWYDNEQYKPPCTNLAKTKRYTIKVSKLLGELITKEDIIRACLK